MRPAARVACNSAVRLTSARLKKAYIENASSQNDENFLVIRGDTDLAQRYCVNIMNVYQHYRWRQYLIECEAKAISPWQGLKKSDHWQDKMSASRRAELDFWVG